MAEPEVSRAIAYFLGGGGGGSPALIRLAFVGSVPRVMLTDHPGLQIRQLCPLPLHGDLGELGNRERFHHLVFRDRD